MSARFRPVTATAVLGLLVTPFGCNGPATPYEIQMAHMDATFDAHRSTFSQMPDNAMLHDMSLADFHFVAHTSELSGTGMARLDRLAEYLSSYGGLVRYESHVPDDALVNQRLAHVSEYLALVGCDMGRVQVERKISGGRTTPANRAIEVEILGTAPPQAATSGATQGAQAMGQQQ